MLVVSEPNLAKVVLAAAQVRRVRKYRVALAPLPGKLLVLWVAGVRDQVPEVPRLHEVVRPSHRVDRASNPPEL